MAIELFVNKILAKFPRNMTHANETYYKKQFTDSEMEKLNVIGGKKILPATLRFYNEIYKRKQLEDKELVSDLLKYDEQTKTIFLEKLGQDLSKTYSNLSFSERNIYSRQMFSILREMHQNGVIDGDSQLRNFIFLDEKQDSIRKTDLEAEWIYEKEGKILDILQLSSDIFSKTKNINEIVYALEDAYGTIQKMPLPKHMTLYFKAGWNTPQEFLDYLQK